MTGSSQRFVLKPRLNVQHGGQERVSKQKVEGEGELKVFASVLADDRNEFALTLETLALKESANVHIFEAIKKELDALSQTGNMLSSFKKGKGNAIDTSVVKLRQEP